MTFDFETDEKAEGPRNLREFTMLVVGFLFVPIAIGLWGTLIVMKIVKLLARLVHLSARRRHSLPGTETPSQKLRTR